MTKRARTDMIVIHCAATPPTMDIGAKEIRLWHTRDNGWRDIGYHSVIRRNGEIEKGRDYHYTGAHVAGHNHNSVGICMVGGVDSKGKPENNFTPEQWESLKREINWILTLFPSCSIIGHRDLDPGKACPSFDVDEWMKNNPL
jgi:N-acetyl-anhydromuramyl-L-alanine amidase AmpD